MIDEINVEGIEIINIECVGHCQKQVGTWLQNLKKKERRTN